MGLIGDCSTSDSLSLAYPVDAKGRFGILRVELISIEMALGLRSIDEGAFCDALTHHCPHHGSLVQLSQCCLEKKWVSAL